MALTLLFSDEMDSSLFTDDRRITPGNAIIATCVSFHSQPRCSTEFANVDYGNSYKVPPDRAAMPELNI